jgi:predicted amidohydrolase YtcJ
VTEAVAVREGRILATGSSASIKSLAGARTRVLDVSGKTVIPGLIDTHAHFKAAGLADYVVNMSRAKTVAEALEAIKAFAARKKPGEWIVGGAWHPPSQLAEKRYLTRQEIDSVAPNNPVYLRTVGHFSMANSMALQKVGVDKTTADPSGGSFERDAAGELTGVLVETAIDRVEKAVPPWTEDDEIRQLTIAGSPRYPYATEDCRVRKSDLAHRRDVPARAPCRSDRVGSDHVGQRGLVGFWRRLAQIRRHQDLLRRRHDAEDSANARRLSRFT